MPDKPLTVATYAAGASLAAIALVYVFGPTYFFDQAEAGSSSQSRAVGLANPANDCFINCILQATAGLPDLRKYLIRELHRRKLDGPGVYKLTEEDFTNEESGRGPKVWKLEGLRQGLVTKALKDVLDALNERPLHRKTISAIGFIRALEDAFRTRISRQQQDAQEFMQIVLERLCEEYHAGRKARLNAAQSHKQSAEAGQATSEEEEPQTSASEPGSNRQATEDDPVSAEDGFPFEGKLVSVIECDTCHFSPKLSATSFVTVTLNVPDKPITTLNECFDGMMKVERISDYICDKCRLLHAVEVKNKTLEICKEDEKRAMIESEIERLQRAIEEDPEKPPVDVQLPDSKSVPKRSIQRHMRVSAFPKILAIHLSRSLFSSVSFSTKNNAKVAFPELLPLGGILDQRRYRLLSVVTHKGAHNSGHYETFRRQTFALPYSTPHSFGRQGVYSSCCSPNLSALQSPPSRPDTAEPATPNSRLSHLSISAGETSSPPPSPKPNPSASNQASQATSAPRETDGLLSNPGPKSATPERPVSARSENKLLSAAEIARIQKKQKKRGIRWWRISDERVKESNTKEVLSLQREAYLLFYELVLEESQ